jgi:hypothetical protein
MSERVRIALEPLGAVVDKGLTVSIIAGVLPSILFADVPIAKISLVFL